MGIALSRTFIFPNPHSFGAAKLKRPRQESLHDFTNLKSRWRLNDLNHTMPFIFTERFYARRVIPQGMHAYDVFLHVVHRVVGEKRLVRSCKGMLGRVATDFCVC